MPEIDDPKINQLKTWYFKKVRSQKSATKRIRNNLYYVLFGNILLFVFMISMVAAHSNDEYVDNSGAMIAGFLALIIPTIGFFLLQSSKSELNDVIEETISKCKQLNEQDYKDLFDTCKEVTNKMNLNEINYQILYAKNNSYFPGILEQSGINYLIIPRNFITLYFKQRSYAKAILYHEFAHVVQNDANNYLLNGILTKKGYYFGLLMLVVTLIIWMTTGMFGVSMVSLIGLSAFFGLGFLRLQSEELADTSVLIYDDGRNLISALERFGVEDASDRKTHPPPIQRIKLLNDKIVRFNLYGSVSKDQIVNSDYSNDNTRQISNITADTIEEHTERRIKSVAET